MGDMPILRDRLKELQTRPGARDYLARNITLDGRDSLWSVIVDVTKGCNLSCPTCWPAGPPSARCGDALIARLKCEVLPHALDIAVGCRHEPLLHPGLPRIIRELRRQRDARGLPARLCLLTSGTLLDAKKSRELARCGLDTILFSIDSADPDCYALVRPPARWPELAARLAGFVRISRPTGLRLAAQALIMKSTLPHLASTLETLADLGIGSFHFSQLAAAPPRGRAEVLRLTARTKMGIVRALARARVAARRRGVELEVPAIAPPPVPGELFPVLAEGGVWDEDRLARSRPALCAAPWFKLRVDHGGYAFPCQMMVDRELAWGNVLEQGFFEIVNGPAAQRTRAGLLAGRAPNPACRACPFGPRVRNRQTPGS